MNRAYLEQLNPRQKEAVCHTRGPLMIVAGAGTGKTRTLTSRIAYLIDGLRTDPEKILAVTFTHRAAAEMQERIAALLNGDETSLPEIGTFHSFSAKILRQEIDHPGLGRDFSILTEEERIEVLREAGAKSIREAKHSLERISAFKNRDRTVAEAPSIYSAYQAALLQRNALDFDDLILLLIRLFEETPRILNKYRDRFRFILVDEYQDVNPPQYRIIRLLSERHQNLCVVGDADQAIYSFRGAHVENFLNFRNDYPGARIVRLEQNYRSTPVILKAAEQVVSKNIKRMEKSLWTREKTGPRIRVLEVDDERQEARWIVSRIEKLLGGTSMFQHDSNRVRAGTGAGCYSFSDMAVLFRLRAQARPLKRALEEAGIPCRTLSGQRLHLRPGTRKALPLLRFLANPADDAALLMILRERVPGFGPKKSQQIRVYAEAQGISTAAALKNGKGIPEREDKACRAARDLVHRLETHRRTRDREGLADLIRNLAAGFDLDEETTLSLRRLSSPYRDRPWGTVLNSFLHDLVLSREVDLFDPRAQAVTLMTMHAAKGLEFPVVFITGLDKGLMPFSRGRHPSSEEIEEERRLFHVAMTRAMKELYLLHARRRILFGNPLPSEPSPFLQDIGRTLYENKSLEKQRRPPRKENPQLGLF